MNGYPTKKFALLRTTGAWAGLLGLLFLLTAVPARAQVSGISYTLSPTGQRVFMPDSAGLSNGYLYGGSFGLSFGKYLTLSGEYLLGNDFTTDFSQYESFAGTAFEDLERQVDIDRYGGTLRLNLGGGFGSTAEILPYLSLGTGIIRFEPEGVDASEQIYATAGAGLTFSVGDRYTLSVGGEMMGYRYNPVTTFLTSGERTAFSDLEDFQETVYVPSVQASLAIYLGGRELEDLTAVDRALLEQFGGGGLRLFVEPFYGRIEFNEALGFPKDQNVAGVNVGLQLGPYIGLRGFYWRGVEGDDFLDGFPESFDAIAFYGGELNLNFSGGFERQGLTPYLIVGGGYMNVLSEYDEDLPSGATPPMDRYFATGGAGVEFALSNALTLQGGLRYLLMSNENVEDVSAPNEVYGSPMYTIGLEFSFGGDEDRTVGEIIERREARRQAREAAMRADQAKREGATRTELQRLQARVDSLERALQQRRMGEGQREGMTAREQQLAEDVARLEEEVRQLKGGAPAEGAEGQARARGASNLSGESVTIPVPEVGEIYVRIGEEGQAEDVQVETVYAPPRVVVPPTGRAVAPPPAAAAQQRQAGQLSAQEIQQIVRETLRSELGEAQAEGRTLSEEDIRDIVRDALSGEGDTGALQMEQIEERLNEIENDLEERLDELTTRLYRQDLLERQNVPPQVRVIDPDDENRNGDEEGYPADRRRGDSYSYVPSRIVPTAGFSFGEDGAFLIGIRGDYGSRGFDLGTYSFRFVPELLIGVIEDFELDLTANAVLDLNVLDEMRSMNQLTPYVGAGLGVTTDTGLGVNLLAGVQYQVRGGAIFAEYSTMDFFDYNRFLIGYRMGF